MPTSTLRRWENNVPTTIENVVPIEEDQVSSSSSSITSILSATESVISSDCNDLYMEPSSEDELPPDSNTFAAKPQTMIYENADISLDQAVFSILDLWVKQKLSKTTLNLQLKLFQSMLPKFNCLPSSIYKFFKYVENQVPPCSIIKHYFCRNCLVYISSTLIETCNECQEKEIAYFFELDFINQIKRLFETSTISKLFKEFKTKQFLSDITDGTEYQRVNIGRHKFDITLIMYTDGVSLSKSSKTHCWPLMLTIAELPPEVRNNHIITAGLWFDRTLKPPMNLFLQPFCMKIQKCFDGIEWTDPLTGKNITSIIKAPLLIADAPARAQVLNMLNFNGRFGCNLCEIETKQCSQVSGKRRVRIYPYKKNLILRYGSRMENQAANVDDSNDLVHIKGVKGYSILSCLPRLDLGTCVIPEYMHSVLLGVVKQVLRIWLCKRGPWKIKKKFKKIDKFLLKIKPNQSFSRMPRSILDFKSYKASELYSWLLFYSIPTLEKILPEVYLQHWMLLVISMFNLLQQKIKLEHIKQSNDLLHAFVKGVKLLYGEREMSYNIHQLLHLSLCVERWGPLWGTSAFAFESRNGFLARIVHGTNKMGEEMMNNLKIAEGANVIKNRVKLQDVSGSRNVFDCQSLGKAVWYKDNTDLLLSSDLDPKSIHFYRRVKINNVTFTSLFYKSTKTNNYTVEFVFKDDSVLYGIIDIFFVYSGNLYFIVKCLDVDEINILQHNKSKATLQHIIPVVDTNNIKLFHIEQIKHLSHLLRVGKYVCKKPNLLKTVL